MQKLSKLADKLTKYGLATILMAIPLYPKFPFVRIPGTYVAIRLEDFILAATTLLFALAFLPDLKRLFKGKLEKSILIYLSVGFISLVSGIVLTKTVIPHIGILHWLRRIEYFLPFFMGLLYFQRRKGEDLEFFFKTLMVVVVLLFIYGFGQKYLNWPVIITQNEEYSKGVALRWVPGSHINSSFAGHYDLATFLVFFLPFFISFFFLLKGLWTKVLLLVVIFSGLWLLTNAVSRISIVAYLLGTTVALFLLKRYKATVLVIITSLVFFSLSSDLLARYTRLLEVTWQRVKAGTKILYQTTSLAVYAQEDLPLRRINNILEQKTTVSVFEDRSTSIRFNVEWPRALRAFKKNPILGTGYSSITLATDNDFLRLLGETGILGFASFGLIFLSLLALIKKIFPLISREEGVNRGFLASYVGGLTGVFLNACFIDVFEASKVAIIFWLITGMFVSIARKTIYDENN